ncbi:MAG: MBL fold metallo-hydrolase [Bacteroidia bacterium]
MQPEIRFLGAGGAHDIHWGNSAALLRWSGKTYLIDCGFTVYPRLVAKNLLETIDAICITHLHDDHIGSLSALLYHRHFRCNLPPIPILVGSEGVQAKLHTILHFLMGEVERFADLRLADGAEGPVVGLPTDGLHMPHMPSSAFLFQSAAGYLLYSGDIGCPVPCLQETDWLKAHQPLWVFHDISFQRVPTHCYYEALYFLLERGIPTWGYHCDPEVAPPDLRLPLVHKEFLLS